MRIGVLSPVAHGTGASCISLLLALRLGQGATERVCLTHVHPSDATLREISGVVGTVDKTTTPSMIIRTFQTAGTMTEQEYAQYCAAVNRYVDLFTCTRSGDAMCSYEDARYLANYVMEKFPHKHVVVDADEHSEGAMLDVIARCDVLVFVTRVSTSNVEMLKTKLAKYMKQGVLSGKKVLVVFNNYHPEIGQQKELAKLLGVPAKSVYFMPLNPYIAWATFNRKMPVLWNFISKGDHRVADIRLELDRMITGMNQKGKTTPTKKETRLFGVKHEAIEEIQAEAKSHAVIISQAARDHAEMLQQLNQEQASKPVQHQPVVNEGLPAGFGSPIQSGFSDAQEQSFSEIIKEQTAETVKDVPVVEPVQEVKEVKDLSAETQSCNALWEDDTTPDLTEVKETVSEQVTEVTSQVLPKEQPEQTPVIPKIEAAVKQEKVEQPAVVKPVEKVAQSEPVRPDVKADFTASVKPAVKAEQSELVKPSVKAEQNGPVRPVLKAEQSEPVKPVVRPVLKPVTPVLPTAGVKPRTTPTVRPQVASLPTTTIASANRGASQSKTATLPTGGIKPTTLGSKGGAK